MSEVDAFLACARLIKRYGWRQKAFGFASHEINDKVFFCLEMRDAKCATIEEGSLYSSITLADHREQTSYSVTLNVFEERIVASNWNEPGGHGYGVYHDVDAMDALARIESALTVDGASSTLAVKVVQSFLYAFDRRFPWFHSLEHYMGSWSRARFEEFLLEKMVELEDSNQYSVCLFHRSDAPSKYMDIIRDSAAFGEYRRIAKGILGRDLVLSCDPNRMVSITFVH